MKDGQTFTPFSRGPYTERLTFILFIQTKQLWVKGLAQGPSNSSLVLGFELVTYLSSTQDLNHSAITANKV